MYQKISIIKQLKQKIVRNCSDQFIEKNLEDMRRILKINNYPTKLINSVFNNCREQRNNQPGDQAKEGTRYIKVPFHKQLAPKLKGLFKGENRKLAFYNVKTTKDLFSKLKDKTRIEDETGVVYAIPCECGQKYYGQTMQLLRNRLKQHQVDIAHKQQKTGLGAHVSSTNHNIHWNRVKIVDREMNNEKRLFLEMAHIISSQDSLNIQSDFNNSNTVYNNILKKFK